MYGVGVTGSGLVGQLACFTSHIHCLSSHIHCIYTMVYVVARTIFLGGGTGVFLRPGGRLSEAEEEGAGSCS